MNPTTDSDILEAQSLVLSDILHETADTGRAGATALILGAISLASMLYQESADWKPYAFAATMNLGGAVHYLTCRFQFKRVARRKLGLDKALHRNMPFIQEPKQARWRNY